MTKLIKNIVNEVTELEKLIKTLPNDIFYSYETSENKIIKLESNNIVLINFAKSKGLK